MRSGISWIIGYIELDLPSNLQNIKHLKRNEKHNQKRVFNKQSPVLAKNLFVKNYNILKKNSKAFYQRFTFEVMAILLDTCNGEFLPDQTKNSPEDNSIRKKVN